MGNIEKDEFNAGYHVSVVRLYQAKDDINNEAKPVKYYPTMDSIKPIGMTDEEFQDFIESYSIE